MTEKKELFEYECTQIRDMIEDIKKLVKAKRSECFQFNNPSYNIDIVEMDENLVLSYRHLEDARMRIGKVMQALQGGVSKYDKKEGVASGVGEEVKGKLEGQKNRLKYSLDVGNEPKAPVAREDIPGGATAKVLGKQNPIVGVRETDQVAECVICRELAFRTVLVKREGKKNETVFLCNPHVQGWPKNATHVIASIEATEKTKDQEKIYQDALKDIIPEIQRILKVIKPGKGVLRKYADEFIDAYGTELTYDILLNAKKTGSTITQLRKYMKNVFEMRTKGTKK